MVLFAAFSVQAAPSDEPNNAEDSQNAQVSADQENVEEQTKDELTEIKEVLAAHQQKYEALEKEIAAFPEPPRALVSRWDRCKTLVTEKVKGIEKRLQELESQQKEQDDLLSRPFVFEVITRENRQNYQVEGEALASEVVAALSTKVESKLVEGLDKFAQLSESYQGLKCYAEAEKLYGSTIKKLEKKWRQTKDRLAEGRKKLKGVALSKAEDSEQAAFEKLTKEMAAAGKDINKEWFVPQPNNLLMLERAASRAKQAMQSLEQNIARRGEPSASVEDLLAEYWNTVEEAISLMQKGKLDEATEMTNNNEPFRELSRQSRGAMPEAMKEALRKQNQAVVEDIRNRRSEVRRISSKYKTTMSALTRELSSVETSLDGVEETLVREKEIAEQKAQEAAEEAARKAEEEAAEAARKAEEEAELEKEEAAADASVKKATKKSKKSH